MTLTQAAFWTRRGGVIVGVLFVLGLSTVFILSNLPGDDPVDNILTPNFRCTDTASEFATSELEIASLQLAANSDPSYSIDTPSGDLGEIPRVANVFEIDNPGASLGAQERAESLASSLGLNPDALQRLRPGVYNWDEDSFGRKMEIDGSTLHIDFETNFRNPQAFPEGSPLPSEQDAINISSRYLNSVNLLLDDFEDGQVQTIPIDILPDGSFAQARSTGEAELWRIDYNRKKSFINVPSTLNDAEEIREQLEQQYFDYETRTIEINTSSGAEEYYQFITEVVTPSFTKSNITVYVGPEDNRDGKEVGTTQGNIYGLDYNAWSVEKEPCGTYPLISPAELDTIINDGSGSLIYLNSETGDSIRPYTPQTASNFRITDVILGYYDTAEEQEFLQPVYIVRGKSSLGSGVTGDFIYYIPAIDYQNLQDAVAPTQKELQQEQQQSGGFF